MPDIAFYDWSFLPATPSGAAAPTTPRTLADRLDERVNVLDFGADPTGGSSSTTAIQAAFDAAFKTSGVDHGSTNSKLNREVYFPGGIYNCNGLTLTNIYGGKIYGAGSECTKLIFNGTPPGAVFSINGFVSSTIEDMTIVGTGFSTSNGVVCIDMDGPANGLHSSMLVNVLMGGSNIGVRVGNSGNDGRSIMLLQCVCSDLGWGIVQKGDANSLVTQVAGGHAQCIYGAWVQSGSYTFLGMSNAGAESGGYPGQTDVRHDSPGTTVLTGGRSESSFHIIANAGKVHSTGILHQSGVPKYSVQGSNNAEVSLTSCFLGNVSANPNGEITGNVNIALRGCTFAREGIDPIFGTGFTSGTGKVIAYSRGSAFTVATLPPNPADGLTVSVSDAGASPTWGAAPGSGSSHALVRWNQTAWTVVGK